MRVEGKIEKKGQRKNNKSDDVEFVSGVNEYDDDQNKPSLNVGKKVGTSWKEATKIMTLKERVKMCDSREKSQVVRKKRTKSGNGKERVW